MRRDSVLQVLSLHKQEIVTKYGVTQLGVFGSVARGEDTPTSDVDVVVHMPPDLFSMVHLKEELEQLLDAPVDLVRYQKHLGALLKRRIDQEAVYV